MSALTYLDHKGRERTIDTEYISRVDPGTGQTAVTLSDETGSAFALNEQQSQMVARQAWSAHKKAVTSCAHCYWHDAREKRGGCPALCCRMREAALLAENSVDLQTYARPQLQADDPIRQWLTSWLVRNVLFFWLCLIFKVPIGLYLSALLAVLGALCMRRLYYYYRSRGRHIT